MKTPKLFSTDYVIYNPIKNYLVRWDTDDDVVIYGTKEEAVERCYESDGEQVVSCTDLPEDLQLILLNQLSNEDL